MRTSPIVVAAAGVLLGVGCSSIASKDIKTDGMSAYLRVIGDGTGQTTASAQFNVDNNPTDFVDLSSGDTAVTSVGGQTVTMGRDDVLGAVTYQTTFTGQDAEGTLYTIALNRSTDVSAPSSTVTMPHPFNITAPTSSASFSRTKDDIHVTYDNSGAADPLSWNTEGNCVSGGSATVSPDNGSFTIPKGTVMPTGASQSSSTCQVTLTLTRTRQGQLDSHYGYGGSIASEHMRTVTFTSTP